MSAPSAGRTAARGGAVTLLGQGGRFFIQALGLVVLAHLLSPADYGRFAEITAVVGIASLLGDGGLSLAALQARELTDRQRSNLFWANTAAGVALAAVVFWISWPLAAFYRDAGLVALTQSLGIVFILAGLQTQFRAHVNAQLRFRLMAVADVGAALLGLLVAIVAAVLGAGAWALVLQQVTVAGTTLLVMAGAARWLPGRPRRTAGMRALFGFGGNALAVQLLNYLSVNVAAIVLGRVAGPTQLGYYNRAYNLFTLPMLQLAAPITRVALPIMSRDLDREVLLRRLVQAQTVLSWPLVGIFLVLAGCADSFVVVAFGPRWTPSVPMFQVLAVGGVFQAIAYVYYWAFLTTGRTRTQLLIAAPARVLMIVLVFPLAVFGGVGVAVSITVGLVLIWLLNSTVGMRAIGLRTAPLLQSALRPVAVFGVGAVLQQLLFRTTPGLPAPVALLCSLALVAVVLAVAIAAVPAVRRDMLALLTVARLVGGTSAVSAT